MPENVGTLVCDFHGPGQIRGPEGNWEMLWGRLPVSSEAGLFPPPIQAAPYALLCSVLCACLITRINVATNNAAGWVLICQTQCSAVIPNTLTFSHEIISIFSD